MTHKNLEIVAITHDISEYGLREGDTGAIVEIYDNGKAFEVEFVNSQGKTIAILTLNSSDLRSLKDSPFYTWSVPTWSGLKQSDIYPTSNSCDAKTEQFFYSQL